MPTRTVKAGAGNWSATGSWVEGAVPTNADDVVTDGSSTGTLTVDSGSARSCRSLTIANGVAVTLASGSLLTIGDGSGGAMNLTGMGTLTLSGGTITFASISSNGGAGWNITTAAKVLPAVTFNGVGGSWKWQDAFTATGATITLTNGTLNTNGQTGVFANFSSNNSNTRTLTLGASSITLTGGNSAWDISAVGLTFSGASSTLTFTGATAQWRHANSTVNVTYGSVVMSGSGVATVNLSTGSAVTLALTNFTRTITAAKTDALSLANDLTVSGTCTLNAHSTTTNRLLVQSNTVGTARTITAAALVCTFVVDFMDIVGAGAATWTTGASGASLFGDAGGNSGISMTPAATQTATGTASFTWSTHGWTSRVPLPQDDVVIALAFSASQTVTSDMPRPGASITWTGTTGSPTWTNSVAQSVFGSVTLVAGVTPSGTNTLTFGGRAVCTLKSVGAIFTQGIALAAPGGSLTLQDAFVSSRSTTALSITAGTFVDDGNSVTLSGASTNFSMSGTSLSTLTKTGAWSIGATAALTFWNVVSGTVSDTGSITLTAASTNTRTFAGGGKTYGTLIYTVANSSGSLAITGANTFNTITVGGGRVLTLPSATTTTVSTFNVNGSVFGYLRLPGVASNYASAPDSAALSITGDIDIRVRVAADDWTPAAEGYFISKSAITGNNLSWQFSMNSAARLKLYASSTGSSYASSATASTALTGAVDGTALWVRVTWRASDGRTQFFQADGSAATPVAADFTQVGTDQTLAIGSIFNGTAPVEIGTTNVGTNPYGGNFYRAQIRDGLDGTLVFDANFAGKAMMANTFTESSAQAATVTITGAQALVGDGRASLDASSAASAATLSMPADQIVRYVMIKDSTASGGYRYGAARSTSVSNNTGWVFASEILQPSGSSTPSGALAKDDGKGLAGTVTPAGTAAKADAKSLSGTVTPVGAPSKDTGHPFSGSCTPTGAVANTAGKGLAGTVTPTGALVRAVGSFLSGSVTPAGSLIRAIGQSLAGSVAPVGTASKNAGKGLGGTCSPVGSPTKAVGKGLTGTVTPAGALSLVGAFTLALSGTISPAGTLAKNAGKRLAGTIAPSGSLLRTIGKALVGLITPSGSLDLMLPPVIQIAEPTYGVLVNDGATSGVLLSDGATYGVLE